MEAEPKITVNGIELTTAQAMTVRVAIQNFAIDLKEQGLGTDVTGMSIAQGYQRCIHTINDIMRVSATAETLAMNHTTRAEREAKALAIIQAALQRVDELGVWAFHRPSGPNQDSMEMAPHRVSVHSKRDHEMPH
jgi:hypothetical protein